MEGFDSLKSDFIKPLKWFGDLMGLEVIFLRLQFDFYTVLHINSDRQPNITPKSWKISFYIKKRKIRKFNLFEIVFVIFFVLLFISLMYC